MPLTPDQQKDARILQLETQNAELRRVMANLQLQLESTRWPLELADREQRWKALEAAVGGSIDRQTLAVTSPAAPPT